MLVKNSQIFGVSDYFPQKWEMCLWASTGEEIPVTYEMYFSQMFAMHRVSPLCITSILPYIYGCTPCIIYNSVMYVTRKRAAESKHHPLFVGELKTANTFFKITGSSSTQFVSFEKFQFRNHQNNSRFSNDYNNQVYQPQTFMFTFQKGYSDTARCS